MNITSYVIITPQKILSNQPIPTYEGFGLDLLNSAFRSMETGYVKFFKMDTLSKLGFLASEILLRQDEDRFVPREDRAVILANSSSSLCDDRHYQASIENADNYFPSPSLFVYTLPNIVTGEIAIRNKYFGETCFYVLPEPDPEQIFRLVNDSFQDRMTTSALCGWVECEDDNIFKAAVLVVEDSPTGMPWNIHELTNILNRI